jgi:NAD(P)-dependent dehydrogenase (short-subunit alcohol dehydrogenase family)
MAQSQGGIMRSIAEIYDLTGKTALVTGASSGLGVTFAQALAQQGANVVLAARRVEQLKTVAESLAPAATLCVRCDIGDPAQVKAAFGEAVERFGRVDIAVNNAGIVPDAGMRPERVPPEVFEQNVRVNLLGTFYCCREAGQIMLADGEGGSIINNASLAGVIGLGNFPAAYQAVKAGMINLTRNLAASWADRGVRVNALAPGWFPSEMTEGPFAIPVFNQWVTNMAPMRRIGRVEELAPALLFLASDASSFVTGQTLVVDGGISACAATWPEAAFDILANAGLGDLARPIGKGKAAAG